MIGILYTGDKVFCTRKINYRNFSFELENKSKFIFIKIWGNGTMTFPLKIVSKKRLDEIIYQEKYIIWSLYRLFTYYVLL